MNRHDAEALAGRLVAEGYEAAPNPDDADIVLYMTCSVRDHAEQRVWSHLGRWRARRASGEVRALGVIGCMAERLGGKIRSRMPHVDIVAGPRRAAEVPLFLEHVLAGGGPVVETGLPEAPELEEHLAPALASRRRPFQAMLPVMRGCDGGCTYCVVPSVRGRETSLPPAEIEKSARELLGKGVIEITLLGQNVDRYGLTLEPRTTLAALLRRLAPVPGLARLRFVTSNPRDITEDLLRAMAEFDDICPYLHVPAQSGSDRVLSMMRRGYTRERYLNVLALARRIVPGIEIASDFIVGFPGETDADFEETLSLVRQAEFQGCFVFKYSPRPGTPASLIDDDVPDEVKRERHRVLSEAQLETGLRRNRALVGGEVEVLAEGVSERDAGRFTGRTPTGRIVAFESGDDPTGRIVPVSVEDATALVLLGRAAPSVASP
jgi:tRNA-2-methylthio-N6-dimethylallyladenosine synthase